MWATFQDDKVGALLAKDYGAESFCWASDYPHPDAKIPGVVVELEEATESLTDEQRRLIFGENAVRLYNL